MAELFFFFLPFSFSYDDPSNTFQLEGGCGRRNRRHEARQSGIYGMGSAWFDDLTSTALAFDESWGKAFTMQHSCVEFADGSRC